MADRAVALRASDWDKPTRCTSWTVRDLLRHVVRGLSLYTEGLTRMARGSAELVPASYLLQVRPEPEAICAGLTAARVQLSDALSAITLEAIHAFFPHRFFVLEGRRGLDLILMEEGIHHNDLSWAVGDKGPLPRDVAAAAFGYASARAPNWAADGPQPNRTVSYRLTGQTVHLGLNWSDGRWLINHQRNSPACEIRGEDSPLSLFLYGRLTLAAARLSVTGDESLARRFKDFFPGP